MSSEAVQKLSKSGSRLVVALSREASLSLRCRHHPDDEALSAELVSVRRSVEACQREYYDSLKEAGYPDLPIRRLLEDGDSAEARRRLRRPKPA